MLPNFKSKILTRLLDTQKNDGPTLFNLMGQCFSGRWSDQMDKRHQEAMPQRRRPYKGELRQMHQGLP
jgi:hypothetical protein